MIRLTPEQMDVLTEMLNIGIGRSASALSEMVGQEVNLSVPKLETVSCGEVIERFAKSGSLTIIQQSFSGAFTGKSLLIFMQRKSAKLVDLILPDMDLNDPALATLTAEDSLSEVGNIILTQCVSGIADLCKIEIDHSLVGLHQGEIQTQLGAGEKDLVLLLQVNFALDQEEIQGDLLFILDMTKMSVIIDYMNKLLESA